MVYYLKNSHSKIIHLEGCRHIKNADKAKIGTFPSITKAYSLGYRLCKHCNLIQNQYKSEKEKILVYCQQNGLSYHQSERIGTVTTPLSKWKISISSDGSHLELYHRNAFEKKGSTSMITNYHFQHATCNTIYEFLDYIFWHDVYRKRHPLVEYSKAKTPPPIKGTKRYRKEQKRLEKKARSRSIANVLSIIESLQPIQNANYSA